MADTVVVGAQGRIVVPVDVRNTFDLVPGERLHVRVEGSSLVLQRPRDAAAELRGLARSVPAGRSLVDELLTERRTEAHAGR